MNNNTAHGGDILDELDRLAEKAKASEWTSPEHMRASVTFQNRLRELYPTLAARLRAAEKVCEALDQHPGEYPSTLMAAWRRAKGDGG